MYQTSSVGTNDALAAQLRPSAGARVCSRETGGFAIAEARYPAHGRSRWHSHDLAGLAVVTGGGYVKRIHRTSHDCVPGSITLEPPGVSHEESYGIADVCVLLVEILPWRHQSIGEGSPLPDAPICSRNGTAVALARRAITELRAGDTASALVLEGIALELVGLASRTGLPSRLSRPWLARVMDRLRAEFRAELTLADLAHGAGVHPAHLTREFRAEHGCSVGEYVRQLRIEWAAARLVGSTEPLTFIAQQAGFCDQSHFTRVFSRQMGIAPSRYRAVHRRD